MLWTIGGLWLLLGLGVTTGVGIALFATGPEVKGWREWMLALGLAAACVAIFLIIEWAGPAGSGG